MFLSFFLPETLPELWLAWSYEYLCSFVSLVYGRGKGYRNNIASLIIRHLDTGSKYRSIPGPTYKLQATKWSNL